MNTGYDRLNALIARRTSKVSEFVRPPTPTLVKKPGYPLLPRDGLDGALQRQLVRVEKLIQRNLSRRVHPQFTIHEKRVQDSILALCNEFDKLRELVWRAKGASDMVGFSTVQDSDGKG